MQFAKEEGQRVKIALNVLILIFSLHSVFKKDYTVEKVSIFDRVLINSFGLVQGGVSDVQSQITSVFDHYFANVEASKENIDLKKRISDLDNQLFSYEELRKENARLKKMLEVDVLPDQRKVLAQIVGWDASSDFNVIRINKGRSSGVELQSTVLTSLGLIGYVYRLTDHFADVLTILDSNNRVDSIVTRTRSHGILEGDSNKKCILKYISTGELLILGDDLITSGLGNLYPKGIRVGKISRIERESYSVTQNISITPAVDFSKLEEVIVLTKTSTEQTQLEWEELDSPDEKSSKRSVK